MNILVVEDDSAIRQELKQLLENALYLGCCGPDGRSRRCGCPGPGGACTIPALDGGHVLFLLYEIIARRKPSDKFMEYAQMVGMFLLFALLIWANFNDIMRFLF